jgi:integrating conjugative element relaxase (TIGR03760 family)
MPTEVILFHRDEKKTKLKLTKPLKDLTAIMEPVQILADNKRQDLLLKIKQSSSFDATRFDQLCVNLIHNVVSYCQSLPETTTSYYASSGGLFDHALNRTEAALQLFRQFVVQGEDNALSEEQKLWLYALFSAALLQGIGKLHTDYRIDLYDDNGQLLKQWQPLLETMGGSGGYYHYDFQQGDEELRCRLNLLLAMRLMPSQGFAWIVSNPQVLPIWLALLNEDSGSAGTLGAILDRADAIAIQRSLSELLKQMGARGARAGRITTFINTRPESSLDRDKIIGAEFINWLIGELEKGNLLIDKNYLLVVTGGMLMSTELFQFFARERPEYKNWLAIQKGFLSWGLHVHGPDGQSISRVEHHTKQLHTGILVSQYAALLPNEMQLHNSHTGDATQITALELGQRITGSKPSQLSLSGNWEPVEAEPVLQLGRNPHG